MASREEILADFQACTGIEDLGLAIHHLEETNWILLDAVNRALPQDNPLPGIGPIAASASPGPHPPTPPPRTDSVPSPVTDPPPSPPPPNPPNRLSFSDLGTSAGASPGFPPNLLSSFGGGSSSGFVLPGVPTFGLPGPAFGGASGSGFGVTLADDFVSVGSSSRTRLLELNIEYRDRMIHLKVPDTESIKVVKTLLQNETGVPPCQQELRGWKGNSPFPFTDRRLLSEMNLPKENFLFLLTPDIPPELLNGDMEQPSPEDLMFKLTILDETRDQTYNLNFPPTHTVLQVKTDVHAVTDIPVYRQRWEGWPANTLDHVTLDKVGIPREHILSVSLQAENSMPVLDAEERDMDVEISDDEYADAPEVMEDDYFMSQIGESSRSGIQPLLPDDFGDEALAGLKFAEEFGNRYGTPHPGFFPGSLNDAISESCTKPASERKMLAVYLHHDSSVLTNVFCTQVLCAEAIVAQLSENFISWGWDLTYSTNKQRLLDMVNRHFGSVAAATVRNFDVERFPLLLLIAKIKGSLEVFQVIHGNVTLDELMSSLLNAQESYQSQVGVEVQAERDSNFRRLEKDEQAYAYNEALLADQNKEVAKKEQEEEAKLQEAIEEAKRRSEVEARDKEAKDKASLMEKAEAKVPQEPAADCGKPMANIRFRPPTGDLFTRRFLATDSLSVLLNFLVSKGYLTGEYKVLSSWPRRDLTQLEDKKSTLLELKLCPQETLTLEQISSGDSDSE